MSNYSAYIWARLYNAIGNEYGTAGLMGNLQAESGLIPYRLQGDFTQGYTKSISYTNRVNSGILSRYDFSHDSKGYGLAQWTYYSRKENYYDFMQSYSSIGDVAGAVSFLIQELQSSYPSVWSTLQSATDIRTASNAVLHDFENPQQQGPDVEDIREGLGIAIYNEYATGGDVPIPVPPEPPTPTAPGWMYGAVSDLMRRKVIYRH